MTDSLTTARQARASRWLVAVVGGVVLLAGLAYVLAPRGAGGSGSTGGASTRESASMAGRAVAPAPAPGGAVTTAGDAKAAAPDVDTTRIVKTGQASLSVRPGGVPGALTRLRDAATGLGGFVADSQTDRSGAAPSGSLTLRVPVAHFDELVDDLADVGDVTTLSTSGKDVTAEYVDDAARLRALETTRETYLTMLGGAHTIGESLQVQQRLDDVQQQIEALQGRQKLLADQSDKATLSVTVTEKGAPGTVPTEATGFTRAWHQATHGFTSGLQTIIAGSGRALLVLLVLLALAGIARLGYAAVRRWSLRPVDH